MLDPGQVAEIEKRMKEEHRLDLEALQRLKRYLPQPDASQAQQRLEVVPSPVVPKKGVRGRTSGLKEAVKDVFSSAVLSGSPATRTWTRPQIKAALDAQGFEIQAKDEVAALNQALRSLVSDGTLHIVVQGTGSRMSEYALEEPWTI